VNRAELVDVGSQNSPVPFTEGEASALAEVIKSVERHWDDVGLVANIDHAVLASAPFDDTEGRYIIILPAVPVVPERHSELPAPDGAESQEVLRLLGVLESVGVNDALPTATQVVSVVHYGHIPRPRAGRGNGLSPPWGRGPALVGGCAPTVYFLKYTIYMLFHFKKRYVKLLYF